MEMMDHRGHWENRDYYHPRKVLKSGTDRWYWSGSDHGPPNEDWIIFKLKTERPVIATRIGIRNYKDHDDGALKRISIEGSFDGKEFEEWIQIDGIKKGMDELQSFDVDLASSHYAMEREWRFYRLRILQNYGWDGNAFYEFVIFGIDE